MKDDKLVVSERHRESGVVVGLGRKEAIVGDAVGLIRNY